MLTIDQIEEILGKCYPGMSERVLSQEEATNRASMVNNDMAAVSFDLRLGTPWPVAIPGCDTIWIPSYPLEGAMYGPEADPDGESNRDAAGPLLSCGEFVRLSKACKLGRKFLSTDRWPSRFASRLRDSQNHLAVIEEILWLGRWRDPTDVEMTYKQNPASRKDIDWRFKCHGMTINLEVKYRMRDWLGIVDGPHFSRRFDSYFNDVEGKFTSRPDGELNIVGITTFSPPDRGLQECTRRFMDRHPEIDAVIFWSIHNPKGKRFDVHTRQPDLIKVLFVGADREDDMFIAPVRHLWRRSEERRALRPDETLPALRSMLKQQHPEA